MHRLRPSVKLNDIRGATTLGIELLVSVWVISMAHLVTEYQGQEGNNLGCSVMPGLLIHCFYIFLTFNHI